MRPVRPRITVHVGVRVMRSKSESLFGAYVNIPRLVQLIIGARPLIDPFAGTSVVWVLVTSSRL